MCFYLYFKRNSNKLLQTEPKAVPKAHFSFYNLQSNETVIIVDFI